MFLFIKTCLFFHFKVFLKHCVKFYDNSTYIVDFDRLYVSLYNL